MYKEKIFIHPHNNNRFDLWLERSKMCNNNQKTTRRKWADLLLRKYLLEPWVPALTIYKMLIVF